MQLLKVAYRPPNRHVVSTKLAGKYKVAVWDSTHNAHDEVVLPLLWTLDGLAIITDLYRNDFRKGAKEILDAYFKGNATAFSSLLHEDLAQIDIILLANSDLDAPQLVYHRFLERYPHLKVVAIVHQLPYWKPPVSKITLPTPENLDRNYLLRPELLAVAQMIRAGRWHFLVHSPHMIEGLVHLLHGQADLQLSKDLVRNATNLFIPVMPVPRIDYGLKNKKLYKASIVGKLSRSRAYSRVIKSLALARKKSPRKWRKSTFLLSLLGSPKGKKHYKIPHQVKSMVKEAVNVIDFAGFYLDLSSSDIVLPAFTNKKRYTSEVASGAIPAAVMARVPVLVDAAELAAYSYLEHPAYILRQEDVDEIQTIQKLRERSDLAATKSANTTAAWELYEQKLYMQNKHALQKALQLPSIPSIPQNGKGFRET